jgi:hypothetical protein
MRKVEILEQLLLPVIERMPEIERDRDIVIKLKAGSQEWMQIKWIQDRYGLKATKIAQMCIEEGFQTIVKAVLNNGN